MDEQGEIVRLKRMLMKFGIFTLVVIIFLVSGWTYEIRRLNHALAAAQTVKVVNGINGSDGSSGVSGVDGINGASGKAGVDGQSVTSDEIVTAVASYCQANGCVGPQGAAGKDGVDGQDGKTLQVQLDSTGCIIQTKYDGDSFWDTLVQLPVPLFCTGTN